MNVFREDVDKRWDQDECRGGLVYEEEWDKLRHGRLEDGLDKVRKLSQRSDGVELCTIC